MNHAQRRSLLTLPGINIVCVFVGRFQSSPDIPSQTDVYIYIVVPSVLSKMDCKPSTQVSLSACLRCRKCPASADICVLSTLLSGDQFLSILGFTRFHRIFIRNFSNNRQLSPNASNSTLLQNMYYIKYVLYFQLGIIQAMSTAIFRPRFNQQKQ